VLRFRLQFRYEYVYSCLLVADTGVGRESCLTGFQAIGPWTADRPFSPETSCPVFDACRLVLTTAILNSA
jgi:hypothetical protein